MNAFVVYNSKYGNTAQIARVIGSVLAAHGPTEVRSIAEAGRIPPETDLLVVGGPTHGHGVDEAMKSFLGGLSPVTMIDVPAAAFDTRIKWPMILSGSAARGITKQLGRLGAQVLVEPGSFIVEGGEGPLAAGELDRATTWAEELATAAARNERVQTALEACAKR